MTLGLQQGAVDRAALLGKPCHFGLGLGDRRAQRLRALARPGRDAALVLAAHALGSETAIRGAGIGFAQHHLAILVEAAGEIGGGAVGDQHQAVRGELQ